MAAPRCSRSLFGPVRNLKSSTSNTASRSFSHTPKSRKESKDGEEAATAASVEDLNTRLQRMGIKPAEYKMLWKSQQMAEKRGQQRQSKTKEEADKAWKEMQNTPDHLGLLQMYKNAGVEPIQLAKKRGIELPGGEKPPVDPEIEKELEALRDPVNVQAIHLQPLRRAPTHGVPVCDLQLRGYAVQNVEFFADFAMRAAYFLGLAARGPIPLPRITERWTVPRSNFIFKKSQENFERITKRRLIQIHDGHPEVVKTWLAFLQKHQYHGVGMKANIWEYESLESALNVGVEIKPNENLGRRQGPVLDKVKEILESKGFKEAMQGHKAPELIESRH